MAPSFSPAVADAVPKISVVLDGDSTSLTESEPAARKVGFINKLQAESDETFDRKKIVVELSPADPTKAAAFFKPGSGVGVADVIELQAESDETFDKTKVVVELSSIDLIMAKAFFKP